MLEQAQVRPEKVTRPIQLLAAWLVGLIVIDGIFLEVALRLGAGTWERRGLVIAAILNVPAFLAALFTLQTRFRAELQDDAHYARYLSKKTAAAVTLEWEPLDVEADEDAGESQVLADGFAAAEPSIEAADPATQPLAWHPWRVALNAQLPRQAELRAALAAAGIPVAEVFGQRGDAPTNRVVSISRALPVAHKAAVLRALLPFGFDGFQLWRPVRDADENEDVYIGSYGTESYARFTPELEALLAGSLDDEQLEDYRRRHRVRDARVDARASA